MSHFPVSKRNRVSTATCITIALLSFCGCSSKPQPPTRPAAPSVPAVPQFSQFIRFQFAIYLLPGHPNDPLAIANRLAAKYFVSSQIVDHLPAEPAHATVSIRLEADVPKHYAPPAPDDLQYYSEGLTAAQSRALQKSPAAIVLTFAHPSSEIWPALYTANLFVDDLARATHGLVWDDDSLQVFTTSVWHTQRVVSWGNQNEVPDVRSQISIDVYRKGHSLRAVSHGMAKMGLPDIVAQNVPGYMEDQAVDLINIFGQALAEGTRVALPSKFTLAMSSVKNAAVKKEESADLKSNAKALAVLSLSTPPSEEDSSNRRVIEIAADSYRAADVYARQDRLLSCFFGYNNEGVRTVKDSPELLNAERQAREKLPELRKLFTAGLRPGESIRLKSPFPMPDGGNENMWVEVTRWNPYFIGGLLDSVPVYATNLHSGQYVDIHEPDVLDYIHKFPDGHEEGNLTGKVIDEEDKKHKLLYEPASPPDCTTN